MSRRINNIIIIEQEQPQQCDQCGKIAELRPYGKNGACICFECAMKDKQETAKNFKKILLGEEEE